MHHDHPPGGIFGLRFRDALRAATFALALRKAIEACRHASEGPDAMRVWLDHPLGADDGVCCVYVTAQALQVAHDAGLEPPAPEPLRGGDFPADRLVIVPPRTADAPRPAARRPPRDDRGRDASS